MRIREGRKHWNNYSWHQRIYFFDIQILNWKEMFAPVTQLLFVDPVCRTNQLPSYFEALRSPWQLCHAATSRKKRLDKVVLLSTSSLALHEDIPTPLMAEKVYQPASDFVTHSINKRCRPEASWYRLETTLRFKLSTDSHITDILICIKRSSVST